MILSNPGTLLKLKGPVVGARVSLKMISPWISPALTLGCLDLPETGSKSLMLLPEMSPLLAQVWILGVVPKRSQDNQASGGLVSGEEEGPRERAGSGILRKQSWIRGLDTLAPGRKSGPKPTGGLICPSPTLSLASLLPACPPLRLHQPQWSQPSLESHCCLFSSSPHLLPRVILQSEGPCLWTPGICLGGEMLGLSLSTMRGFTATPQVPLFPF